MLDKRLHTVSEMIVKAKPLADIGTDHAYLPIYLIKNGLVPFAIATDMPDGPYIRAANEVKKAGLMDKIEIRQGDGLKVIEAGEVYNIVIAGMGGETIARILEDDWQKTMSFEHFVFQPMSRPDMLRVFLAGKGWRLLDEKVVRENNRFFTVMSYEPGDKPYFLSPLEAEIGPVILKSKDYIPFLRYYLKKYCSIESELKKSEGESELKLLDDYRTKIKELKEVLNGQG